MESNRRGSRRIRGLSLVFLFLAVALLPEPRAMAHRAYLFAWIEGDTVYTESYFSGNKAVRGGEIKVLDLKGNELLRGRTDEKGEFSFKIPASKTLRIVLEETTGHGAEYILTAEETGQSGKVQEAERKEVRPTEVEKAKGRSELDQVRKAVEEALDTRLKHIQRSLARIEKERSPGFRDVIGGLGYIFGLMGIILYLKSRKKR